MIRVLVAALALLFFALAPAAAPALEERERIHEFASDITIRRDGTVDVVETITVQAQGDVIQRGIFREFPTTYTDRQGFRRRVGFDVTGVTRDGMPEPYAVERITNGRRVRIGREDVLIAPGRHVYVITYRTDRQIGFFDMHDELYWNVTGFWPFPIELAEAVVRVPGATILEHDFYTGALGARDKNGTAESLSADTIRFRSAPLAPEQGLTIAVAFPKGVVIPPSGAARTVDFFRDNAPNLGAVLGLVALFVYYLTAWFHFGRDPARGVVVPLFSPPRDFSAPAVRFVNRMGYDRKTFAAALVQMAVKGFLTISEETGTYTLRRTEASEDSARLSPPERAIAKALFGGRREIVLKNSNHRAVSAAISALRQSLRKEDEGVYFVSNRGWFFGGLAILVISGGLTALLSDVPELTGFLLLWLSVWSAATSALVYHMARSWQHVFDGYGNIIIDIGGALGATFFAVVFTAPLIAAVLIFAFQVPLVPLIGLVVQGILAAVFYRLLKAPTTAGAKVMDQIEGFGMFLRTAEQHRLEVLHPPHVTPELFEKYLPYAIALDAENEWARKFELEAARAGAAPEQRQYHPRWYSGSGRMSPSSFASSIGSAVASATAAAATAPGKSSGIGGGGSVGGGGGGGRGGGW